MGELRGGFGVGTKRTAAARILEDAYELASRSLDVPLITDVGTLERVEYVCGSPNRACVRLLLACLVAKVANPDVDIRKPYTAIGGGDSYSGRTYDERFVTSFVAAHRLPCNPTTAFLTPALRNINTMLTPDQRVEGNPPVLYQRAFELLDDVQRGRVSASDLLAETVRQLIVVRDRNERRMRELLDELRRGVDRAPLSSEQTVTLIQQHLASPRASRLPVIVVAAAYAAAEDRLGERALTLRGHNAADRQTQALGDIEIALLGDGDVRTIYEMKDRRVTRDDIDQALAKVKRFRAERSARVDNYIFVTTDVIDADVQEYARSMYDRTGGVEFAILDCLGFLRHFLHLFHRLRVPFLDAYQRLVLEEPDSAVSQPLKESFLALRRAAESQVAGA